MAEIGFYHLTRTEADQALPPLLGRTLKAGHRAMVICGADRVAALDAALWACADPDWLPHGTAATGDPDMQPIWIGPPETAAGGAPNGARYLFLLDDAQAPDLFAYDRVFDLFDGRDEAKTALARERWRTAKDAGHSLTYWQQTAKGWEKR